MFARRKKEDIYKMRNIFLVSYGIIEYDGRLKELINICNYIGETYVICCSLGTEDTARRKYIRVRKKNYLKMRTYFLFILKAIMYGRQLKNVDVICSDNLFAALPTLILCKKMKIRAVLQDVRELYFYKNMQGVNKILSFFENKLMHKADIVLCANKQRARIMQERFGLKKLLVFENIRFLEGDFDENDLKRKYKDVFKYKYNLISTSGLFMSRNTDILIRSMRHLNPREYGLFFVGNSSDTDKSLAEGIMLENGISNVHVLGKVPMNELKYVVRQCQIGVIHYHKNDLNNIYCASGKIYEFLHEGLPIVTTENIPLKEFCEQYNVGVANDNFSDGIKKISGDYPAYCERINKFINGMSIENYNLSIAEKIKSNLFNE
jgi:hypothetical protein